MIRIEKERRRVWRANWCFSRRRVRHSNSCFCLRHVKQLVNKSWKLLFFSYIARVRLWMKVCAQGQRTTWGHARFEPEVCTRRVAHDSKNKSNSTSAWVMKLLIQVNLNIDRRRPTNHWWFNKSKVNLRKFDLAKPQLSINPSTFFVRLLQSNKSPIRKTINPFQLTAVLSFLN